MFSLFTPFEVYVFDLFVPDLIEDPFAWLFVALRVIFCSLAGSKLSSLLNGVFPW